MSGLKSIGDVSCLRTAEGRPDRTTNRRDVEDRIKAHNERRLHSAIGYHTPTSARLAWHEHMTTAAY